MSQTKGASLFGRPSATARRCTFPPSFTLHPGGLNVLLGDGSVRFLKETIDSWPFDPLSGNPRGVVANPLD